MKMIFKIAFLFALAASLIQAQTPAVQKITQPATNVSPEAERVSVEVVKLFKQQKFEEALPFALKAVEINSKELGASHLKTAEAYVNLGYVQGELGKKKEATAAFENALVIFDKNPNLSKTDSLILAKMLETLGILKFDSGKAGGSEKYLRLALELREKLNGEEAAETNSTRWSLGNLNASVGNNEQAAAFYRRVYEIRLKKLGAGSFDTSDALNRCRCTLLKAGKHEEADSLKQQFDSIDKPKQVAFSNTILGGVVNGKALKLVQPPYPQAAKADRASGRINVAVTIDESGKVIYACGADNPKAHPALIASAEWAAYNSKFTSTLVKDKPVKVTGVIVYNFVAR